MTTISMTIPSFTPTPFEIEFDSRHLLFKESLSSSCFFGHQDDEDDLSSTESTFHGEDCLSVSFDDDYFDDDGSASTCSSNSLSSSSSSSCSSSESSISMAPSTRRALTPFGEEDSIVLARGRSQHRSPTDQQEQDQEENTSSLLEGLTFEIPLKPLESKIDRFYPAAAAA
jgi:hypothetical protein